MIQINERHALLEIASPMPAGRRILFAAMGLVPLLAPYELLLEAEWKSYRHPVFLFAVLISAGAVAVSLFLLFAAVVGLSSRMRFDAARSIFTYSAAAPVVPFRSRTHPLSAVAQVSIRTHDWSEGAPSYSLRVTTSEGASHDSASSWVREEVERCEGRLKTFLKDHGRPSAWGVK